MLLSLNMYAILEKPLNAAKKVNFEHKQDVPSSWSLIWCGLLLWILNKHHLYELL